MHHCTSAVKERSGPALLTACNPVQPCERNPVQPIKRSEAGQLFKAGLRELKEMKENKKSWISEIKNSSLFLNEKSGIAEKGKHPHKHEKVQVSLV